MGVPCSKSCQCLKAEQPRPQWMVQMGNMGPDELLEYVLANSEAFEACQTDVILRDLYIAAAGRKYLQEKFFDHTVHNRTAPFMLFLDKLLQIRNELEQKKLRRQKREDFPLCFLARSDRQGDAFENGFE